ncbi:peptide transporter family 1 [Trichonephila clavipes]|nr:peptide transporter family 1 [Trichonephila clavipes]
MRTVLTIYLTEELLYSDSKATVIFHSFIMLSYFTPLLGAILADSYLGKFKTILYISIVYAIGNIILSVGSIPNEMNIMKGVSLLGLLIIGIGTGGIKPCVSAFGGDQFSSNQKKECERFFSIFYFAINGGSVVSTILTPILRADVHCFGSDSCYPLAYGIPAALMLVALILFLIEPSTNLVRVGTDACKSIINSILRYKDYDSHKNAHKDFQKRFVNNRSIDMGVQFMIDYGLEMI